MALGSKLREAREALGLSQSEVADKTHIMVQIIRELEAEDYHRFSAAIYGKGFIKLYAKAVGVDPDPLIAEFLATYDGGDDAAPKPKKILEKKNIIPVEKEETVPDDIPEEETEDESASAAADVEESLPDEEEQVDIPAETTEVKEVPVKEKPQLIRTTSGMPSSVRASSVTMPNPDVKRVTAPVISGRASQLRAIPSQASTHPQPVKPPPGEHVPAAAEDKPEQAATPPAKEKDNVFRLQADTVQSATPPRPTRNDLEPFQYPVSPKKEVQKERADKAVVPDEEADDTSAIFAASKQQEKRKKTREAPFIRAKKKGPAFGDYVKHGYVIIAGFVESLMARLSVSSEVDEETLARKRYRASSFAVIFLVILIVIAAASLSRKDKTGKDSEVASEPVDEEVIVSVDEPVPEVDIAQVEREEEVPEEIPIISAEIVRVLPAPKIFAR